MAKYATNQVWDRAIILADMNAFFASVEQKDHPEYESRAIGITNGKTGTCIITCSYEARAHGIYTGMRVKEARQLCPDFIQVPARPERYAYVSQNIMQALTQISPDLEVFSVDEAFLDVTRCQKLFGSPAEIGLLVKQTIFDASGVLCSIGVSGDKTTAKWAAKQNKPNGFTVIEPWEAKARLRPVPVQELCGIARGIGRFLAERGVHTCGDMERLPIGVLAKRFGNIGRRIWLMAQGLDPLPVTPHVASPKSIGHGKVMPPNTQSQAVILTYLEHMSFKVGTRLRRHQLVAQKFFVGLRAQYGWIGAQYRSTLPTNDGLEIMKLTRQLLNEYWDGSGVSQIQITALDPRPDQGQLELFAPPASAPQHDASNAAMDTVNTRYGEYKLIPARLIQRSDMPNVISPAWKPDGHRQTI